MFRWARIRLPGFGLWLITPWGLTRLQTSIPSQRPGCIVPGARLRVPFQELPATPALAGLMWRTLCDRVPVDKSVPGIALRRSFSSGRRSFGVLGLMRLF